MRGPGDRLAGSRSFGALRVVNGVPVSMSHEATCGAAAAATLLNLRGIPATEQGMIRRCLTSRHGTEPLGLYRGLKLATEGLGPDVRVASHDPAEWIDENQLPNVALIQFALRVTPSI